MGSGGNTPTANADALTLRQALEIVRNSEGNEVDQSVIAFLERAFTEIWARLEDNPDSYLLSRDEFACFNFFQDRHRGSETAQKAIQRYWDNPQN
jgi:hypothetical protein